MAKNKSATEDQKPPESADFDGTPAKQDDDEVIGHVSLTTLKHGDNQTLRIRIVEAIQEKQKIEKVEQVDPLNGVKRVVEVAGTIQTMKVVDLATGKLHIYVPGTILAKDLKDYGGGNQHYVGLCFRLTKHPAAEGKRAKRCEVVQIRDPDHAK